MADRIPRPGLRFGDHRLLQFLSEVCSREPAPSITLLVADWSTAPCADDVVRKLGVETVSRAPDWDEWFAAQVPDLLVVHGAVAAHRFGAHLDRAYPGVPRLVDTTAFGALFDAAPPLAPLDGDADGRSIVRQVALDQDLDLLAAATVISCASAKEAALIEEMSKTTSSFVLRSHASVPSTVVPLALRRDLAVIGSFVEGVCSPDEDAVMFLAHEVMPNVWRDCDATVHVFGEDASPNVRAISGQFRYHVVNDSLVRSLRNARAVVSLRRFGRGSTAAPNVAVEAGVPLLVGRSVADALDVSPALVVDDDASALADSIRECLRDDAAWGERSRATSQWAATLSSEEYRSVLDTALADLGLRLSRASTRPLAIRWGRREHRRWVPDPERRVAPSVPSLELALEDQVTTDGVPDPEQLLTFPLVSPYHEWIRSRDPSPRQRWANEARATSLPYRPLVSLVIAVLDSEPDALATTVRSVRDQVYANWEILIADDCSTNLETLAALADEARADPHVRVVRIASPVGEADAANTALERARGEFVGFVVPGDQLEPLALLEVVDLLNRVPDLDLVYTDEHEYDRATRRRCNPSLKPSWSPDLLRSMNYVGQLALFRSELVRRLGGLRRRHAGALGYDLVLRVANATDRVGHVAQPLYRSEAGRAPSPESIAAGRGALADAVARNGEAAAVDDLDRVGAYRVRYAISARPRVDIVIATRDRRDLLEAAIASIREVSTYENVLISVIDNQSRDQATLEYLEHHDGRVLRYDAPFNYARMMNLGIMSSRSDLVLLLNNDVEVRQPDWIETMVEHAQRSSVGAVGARLSLPSGALVHQGVFVGGGGGAANIVFAEDRFDGEDQHFLAGLGDVTANFAAVTGACMMARPAVLAEVGGFDERLHVAFNDVDLCLKLRARGYEIVCTPFASVVHDQSSTRCDTHPMKNDERFRARWRADGEFEDPYSNPNYDQHRRFALRPTWERLAGW